MKFPFSIGSLKIEYIAVEFFKSVLENSFSLWNQSYFAIFLSCHCILDAVLQALHVFAELAAI